jgi:hypothetical protein
VSCSKVPGKHRSSRTWKPLRDIRDALHNESAARRAALFIQRERAAGTAWTHPTPVRTIRCVRVLPHIKRLDECFGDFLVRVTCPCGTSRHIEPEALARIAGRSVTLAALSTRMRCSQCGKKVAEVVAVARPRPRGGGRSPPK